MALVQCCVCLKNFERRGKFNIKNIPDDKKVWKHLDPNNKKDKYSPFRFFYNLCKRRAKEKLSLGFDLTLEDIKNQWEKQKGVCPHTSWKLKISESLSAKNKIRKSPDRASLDRIDSTKGYVKGNIQFVSLISQYAKNDWDEEVIFEFANAVKVKK